MENVSIPESRTASQGTPRTQLIATGGGRGHKKSASPNVVE